MISWLYRKNAVIMSFFNMLLLMVGIIHRIWGLDSDLSEEKGKIIMNVVTALIMIPIFIYINIALANNATESTRMASELISEMKTIKKITKEYSEMLQSLQEGIVVVKDGTVNFSNEIFKDILGRAELQGSQTSDILDLNMYKEYRKEN